MKCPDCGSKNIQPWIFSENGYICNSCGIVFKEPLKDKQISRIEGYAHIG